MPISDYRLNLLRRLIKKYNSFNSLSAGTAGRNQLLIENLTSENDTILIKGIVNYDY